MLLHPKQSGHPMEDANHCGAACVQPLLFIRLQYLIWAERFRQGMHACMRARTAGVWTVQWGMEGRAAHHMLLLLQGPGGHDVPGAALQEWQHVANEGVASRRYWDIRQAPADADGPSHGAQQLQKHVGNNARPHQHRHRP